MMRLDTVHLSHRRASKTGVVEELMLDSAQLFWRCMVTASSLPAWQSRTHGRT